MTDPQLMALKVCRKMAERMALEYVAAIDLTSKVSIQPLRTIIETFALLLSDLDRPESMDRWKAALWAATTGEPVPVGGLTWTAEEHPSEEWPDGVYRTWRLTAIPRVGDRSADVVLFGPVVWEHYRDGGQLRAGNVTTTTGGAAAHAEPMAALRAAILERFSAPTTPAAPQGGKDTDNEGGSHA